MTTTEHIERLESLAVELDKAMAFLDTATPGETYWQELDAASLRAGAAALKRLEATESTTCDMSPKTTSGTLEAPDATR